MSKNPFDFELRRLKFIEACAYYIRIKGTYGDIDRLVMTNELADLITARFKMANLHWAIGSSKSYGRQLDEAMKEKLPDFNGEKLTKSAVLRYNFRSMVVNEVRNKEVLCKRSSTLNLVDENANNVCSLALPNGKSKPNPEEQTIQPSATPHDFLKGFTVYIKPDVHLDETVPICARDQHLLYNIFGDKWKSALILRTYIAVKGQTGFMHNWTSNGKI